MTTQNILTKIINIESELQNLKLEAYLRLPQKSRKKLSEIANNTPLPRLTTRQIQKEIEAYRHGR